MYLKLCWLALADTGWLLLVFGGGTVKVQKSSASSELKSRKDVNSLISRRRVRERERERERESERARERNSESRKEGGRKGGGGRERETVMPSYIHHWHRAELEREREREREDRDLLHQVIN
jgi:hypothetical protein